MILNKIEDPRDNLEKARRSELFAFAQRNGIAEISTEDMPAILMRKILRSKGMTRITIPRRVLGQFNGPSGGTVAPQSSDQAVEVNADDDLMRQFIAQSKQAAPKGVAQMDINELRAECKRLGIKMERRDNMITMRTKIEGHGQNTAERSQ